MWSNILRNNTHFPSQPSRITLRNPPNKIRVFVKSVLLLVVNCEFCEMTRRKKKNVTCIILTYRHCLVKQNRAEKKKGAEDLIPRNHLKFWNLSNSIIPYLTNKQKSFYFNKYFYTREKYFYTRKICYFLHMEKSRRQKFYCEISCPIKVNVF